MSRTPRAAPAVLMTAAIGAVVVAEVGPVGAHAQPAMDENNRYLKLTPMGDRVRLAYTIFLGERPGAALRGHLDRDRDGQIDDREAAAYGAEIAALVRPAVTVTLDGRPAAIAWTTIDVGLGTPSVTAGAFSVDLVGWLCTRGSAHQLTLHDTVRLDRPGESELRLEDGPGIHLGRRTLGGRALDGLDQTWTGADGPLTLGLELAWTVDQSAARPADGRCSAGASVARGWWSWSVGIGLLIAVAIGLVIGGGARLFRGPRRQRGVSGT